MSNICKCRQCFDQQDCTTHFVRSKPLKLQAEYSKKYPTFCILVGISTRTWEVSATDLVRRDAVGTLMIAQKKK